MLSQTPWLTIILPCWHDRAGVVERIDTIRRGGVLGGAAEFVVADATPVDSKAQTLPTLARESGIHWLTELPPGRGGQLRAGAKLATAPLLLFHHADNELYEDHLESLAGYLRRHPQTQAGAFHRDIAGNWPRLPDVEAYTRAFGQRRGILFGDQSVWVKRKFYHQIGGIRPLPLMEDVEFSDRLRRTTRPVLLDPPMTASMRRFERRGSWRNKLANLKFIALYRLGMSAKELHRRYYRRGRGG